MSNKGPESRKGANPSRPASRERKREEASASGGIVEQEEPKPSNRPTRDRSPSAHSLSPFRSSGAPRSQNDEGKRELSGGKSPTSPHRDDNAVAFDVRSALSSEGALENTTPLHKEIGAGVLGASLLRSGDSESGLSPFPVKASPIHVQRKHDVKSELRFDQILAGMKNQRHTRKDVVAEAMRDEDTAQVEETDLRWGRDGSRKFLSGARDAFETKLPEHQDFSKWREEDDAGADLVDCHRTGDAVLTLSPVLNAPLGAPAPGSDHDRARVSSSSACSAKIGEGSENRDTATAAEAEGATDVSDDAADNLWNGKKPAGSVSREGSWSPTMQRDAIEDPEAITAAERWNVPSSSILCKTELVAMLADALQETKGEKSLSSSHSLSGGSPEKSMQAV